MKKPQNKSIKSLLSTISDRWTTFAPDQLSSAEEKALALMITAGLVERRLSFRMQMLGDPVSIEATISATGEQGAFNALEPLAAALWDEWGEKWKHWKDGEASAVAPFHCQQVGEQEWRLTAQGVQAKGDIEAGKLSMVCDFVLREGFFEDREAVQGESSLVKMEKKSSAAVPSVNVANWQEGGDAFAQSFAPMVEKLFESMMKAKDKKSESDTSHSSDFISVNWFGTRYTFSKGNQARAVKALWEAWEQGGHGLTQETIGEKVGSVSDSFRMNKTFRKQLKDGTYEMHPAWDTIIKADGKGSFRLYPPEK